MRLLQSEGVDEPGGGIGIAGHAEVLRGVPRASAAGRIPRDDVELAGQAVELGMPVATVAPPSMQEQHGGTAPCAPVGDRAAVERRHLLGRLQFGSVGRNLFLTRSHRCVLWLWLRWNRSMDVLLSCVAPLHRTLPCMVGQ